MKWSACPGSSVTCGDTISTCDEFVFCQAKPVRPRKRRLSRPSSSLYLGIQEQRKYRDGSKQFSTRSNLDESQKPVSHTTTFTRSSAIRVRKPKPHRNAHFDQLLNHQLGVSAFRGFLSSEYSEDNLNFWLECERYRKANDNELAVLGKYIVEKYLTPGSPHEVNVNFVSRRYAQLNGLEGKREAFDVVQQHIYQLMSNDSFRRFSNDYATLMPYLNSITMFLQDPGCPNFSSLS
uniref:Regulator of G-protein signaling 5-like n=1 Tax=Phallusia mammillata TaxID=59560 RepID=A0A6F9DR17_9ASCI|nr:regulator of G-protein signaling 5-like [Phallusia mammillata]